MRVSLLHPPDRPERSTSNGDNTFDDLGLATLCEAAAADPFVRGAIRAALMAPTTDPEVIRYRHAVLADCRAHPAVVRELYRIAALATEVKRRKVGPAHRAGGRLLLALEPLTELISCLRQLRAVCDSDGHHFRAPGFTALMRVVATDLDDGYLDDLEAQLAAMDFDYGVHLSAGLGAGNTVSDIVLHAPLRRRRFGFDRRTGRAFRVTDEPDPEFDPVARLRDRAVSVIADVVQDAADHVQDFFRHLRGELAFYLGCLALQDRFRAAGLPVCLPTPHPAGTPRLRCTGLRDVTLALTSQMPVIGNDIDAVGRTLIVVTGANSGGKSTLLRSLGAAQLMMQAGMPVLADSFEADVRAGVFTHFVAEEDRGLSHGKLVDELSRMSRIVDRLTPNSLLLCNESFSSTSESDATRIAVPILSALLSTGIAIVFVTHLYEFAHQRHRSAHPTDLFLRARPHPDGTRTFHFTPAPPDPTSHAADVFHQIFGRPPRDWGSR
ncbi:DNA mismatch repair protein [Nocardia yunnanensis]|uniref:DNA mismatch repair protein n=1 Tax=Nocardia yunnanensis TaxID=2382165 RepID=A0A386ZM05_9NOCA|nr:DNA mismatch repair protein [Nocardia yunnanensis]AYF78486.1 DNA mismatch repair protein [Nocardia yunnanensis]